MTTTLEKASIAGVSPRGRGWRRYRASTFYLFAAPWILGFLALTLAPVVFALGVSLTNYDGSSPRWRFVGLRNYVDIFTTTPGAAESLVRTLGYAAIVVPSSVAGGLGLALLVNRRIRARGVVRAVFFLPSVVPVVAVAITWRLIFNRDAGLVNGILGFLGGPTPSWLSDPLSFTALVVMTSWGLGGGMIITLAALQDVPQELEEAARIDGAGTWRVIRDVTVPMISPVLYFQAVTGIIAALQVLVQPLLLVEGSRLSAGSTSVPESSTLYMVYVYDEFFVNHRFGFGSAMLWVFFVVILAVTLVLQKLSGRFVFYQVDADQK